MPIIGVPTSKEVFKATHTCSPPTRTGEHWSEPIYPWGTFWICDECNDVYVAKKYDWYSMAHGEMSRKDKRKAKKFRREYLRGISDRHVISLDVPPPEIYEPKPRDEALDDLMKSLEDINPDPVGYAVIDTTYILGANVRVVREQHQAENIFKMLKANDAAENKVICKVVPITVENNRG
ncbi:hypothetical protein SEA_JUMBO_44 [Gordonia phage Jumbo]|uniref:Uncharacterized protein n=1 Tax=Gordonia phage Jumbo TaxID=1887650 RepID=A0A1B3B0M8_9CAUD|nr:hypothetical protein BIZ69_gp044 [Gordonia phage Jumbo]AOE44554.1 hypothetical protein SEA_JUMBO_44 [Gordonia phage Jumbo]